jgi:hypothetical protein
MGEFEPVFRNVLSHQLSLIPSNFHMLIISPREQHLLQEWINSNLKSTINGSFKPIYTFTPTKDA